MNAYTQSRKTTYGAIVGIISVIASVFGYTIEPTQAQLITSILVAMSGIATAIVGYFAKDADAIIDKVQNAAQIAPAEQKQAIDDILNTLKNAINDQQAKIAEAQNAIQQVEQLKAQHTSIVTQLKQQLNL